jgi:hypothetical protein
MLSRNRTSESVTRVAFVLIFQDVPGSNLSPETEFANKFRGFLNPSVKKKVWVVPEIRSRLVRSTPFTVYHSGYDGPNLEDVSRILGT